MGKLFTLLLLAISFSGFGQVYQNFNAYGWEVNRIKINGGLTLPTYAGLPSIGTVSNSSVNLRGTLIYNTNDSTMYGWSGTQWRAVGSGGGGGTYLGAYGIQLAGSTFRLNDTTIARRATIISAGEFGAVNSVEVDNKAAIQAAIDYAETLPSAIVTLETGANYRINSSLSIPDNVIIDGNGASITQYGNNKAIFYFGKSADAFQMGLKNINLAYNTQQTNTDSAAIYLSKGGITTANIQIQDVYINQCATAIAIGNTPSAFTFHVTIQDINVQNWSGYLYDGRGDADGAQTNINIRTIYGNSPTSTAIGYRFRNHVSLFAENIGADALQTDNFILCESSQGTINSCAFEFGRFSGTTGNAFWVDGGAMNFKNIDMFDCRFNNSSDFNLFRASSNAKVHIDNVYNKSMQKSGAGNFNTVLAGSSTDATEVYVTKYQQLINVPETPRISYFNWNTAPLQLRQFNDTILCQNNGGNYIYYAQGTPSTPVTAGTYVRGDRIMNQDPQGTNILSWFCNTTGTTGGWTAVYNSSGTVTSVATGYGLTGGTITTTGTIVADSTTATGLVSKDRLTAALASKLNISDTAAMVAGYLPIAGRTYTTTTGNGLALTSSTLTSGNLVNLTTTGTGAINGHRALNINLSGANATGSQATYGIVAENVKTGSGTNYAGYFNASGGTTNYAIYSPAGSVVFAGGSVSNSSANDVSIGSSALHGSTGGGGSGNRLVMCNGSGDVDFRTHSSFKLLYSFGTNITNGGAPTVLANMTAGGLSIGNTTVAVNASALIDMTSTTKGFLPPRMTATQGSAIASPAEGLLIYVTNTNGTFTAKGWWGYDGSAWQKLNN